MKSIFTNQEEKLVKRKSFPDKENAPAIGDHMKIKENKVRRFDQGLAMIQQFIKRESVFVK